MNLEFVASINGGEVSEFRDVDDRHRIEGQNHLVRHTVLLAEGGLVLQISQGSVIVWKNTKIIDLNFVS